MTQLPKETLNRQLGFLVDGQTTREEVLLTLGMPSAQFEGERILTFVLYADPATQQMRLVPREAVTHEQNPRWKYSAPDLASLVLVFGTDNVLDRHSLVMGSSPVP
jgi:hypothetical protein